MSRRQLLELNIVILNIKLYFLAFLMLQLHFQGISAKLL